MRGLHAFCIATRTSLPPNGVPGLFAIVTRLTLIRNTTYNFNYCIGKCKSTMWSRAILIIWTRRASSSASQRAQNESFLR
jgi:hypothetical protein